MFLINGLEQDTLPASDRAVQFGDGCFTTARILDGHVCLLEAHIRRLQHGCEKLMTPFTHWDTLRQEMCQLASGKHSGVLKVIISRGSGGRGYSAASCLAPTRILSVSAYPAHYSRWREDGVTLTLSPVRLGRTRCWPGLSISIAWNRCSFVLILNRRTPMRPLSLTAKGSLRNAVRLICSGDRAGTCSPPRWIRLA